MERKRKGKGTVIQFGKFKLEPCKKLRAKPKSEEYQEQTAFVEWLELRRIIYYHIPNGGWRYPGVAVKLKKMGLRPGVPDICIPMPSKSAIGCFGDAFTRGVATTLLGNDRSCYHGLYIELKRKGGGRLSNEQFWWIKQLQKQGYCAVVCYGCDDAIRTVEDYFR